MPLRLWLPFIATALAVPEFHVNLDLPPSERWRDATLHYRDDLEGMMRIWKYELIVAVGKEGMANWLNALTYPEELVDEMRGIARYANNRHVTLDILKTWNAMYEMNHPTFCSAILAADSDGNVVHGRNMDYGFVWQKEYDAHTRDLMEITAHIIFYKKGRKLFVSSGWPGHVGVQTGMRYGHNGFSMQVNLRPNTHKENLGAAVKGAWTHGAILRHYLEHGPDYATVVAKVYNESRFIAPCYVMVAGTGPYEGTIITIDRNAAHEALTPNPYKLSRNQWHLVQTNEDLTDIPLDGRRHFINNALSLFNPRDVDLSFMLQQMRTPGAFNIETKFTTVMQPHTDFYKTFLANEVAAIEGTRPHPRKVSAYSDRRSTGWHRFLAPRPQPKFHI